MGVHSPYCLADANTTQSDDDLQVAIDPTPHYLQLARVSPLDRDMIVDEKSLASAPWTTISWEVGGCHEASLIVFGSRYRM